MDSWSNSGASSSDNVVPALVVLTAVVFVHEMGHFLVARWCGIRVAAFSIGFGRELFGFTDRRGTRWKVSAVPLGGYVRFEGDDNAASVPDPEALAATPLSERQGLFHFAPLWKRILVVAAGPAANFILAMLVFAALFVFVGRPHILPVAETVIAGKRRGARRTSSRATGSSASTAADRNVHRPAEHRHARGRREARLRRRAGRPGGHADGHAGAQEEPDRLGGTHKIGVLGITGAAGDFRRDDPLTALVEGARETEQHRRPDADLYRAAASGAARAPTNFPARFASGRCPARSSRPAEFPG